MGNSILRYLLVLLMGTLVLGVSSQIVWSGPKGEIIIFHADSLTAPFDKMEKEFKAKYPRITIRRDAGGSIKLAEMIADGKSADIMASADYTVIDKDLIPEKASWNVRFAANQLVLCYTDKSKYAKEIDSKNWYEILGREGVKWGHSDPNSDPCGYRSFMVIKLAETFYKKPGLLKKLVENRPKADVKSNAMELLPLLKSGELDYAWEYLSIAVQNKLQYVQLSNHINLGHYQFNKFYKTATVDVTGKKPGTTVQWPLDLSHHGFFQWARRLIQLRKRYSGLKLSGYNPAETGSFTWLIGPWMEARQGGGKLALGWRSRPNNWAHDSLIIMLNFEKHQVTVDVDFGIRGIWVKLADIDRVNDTPPFGTNSADQPTAVHTRDGYVRGFSLPGSSGFIYKWEAPTG